MSQDGNTKVTYSALFAVNYSIQMYEKQQFFVLGSELGEVT